MLCAWQIPTPQDTQTALATAMASIAQSPELRARLVENAMENLRKNHAVDAIVDRYLELLGLPLRVAESPAAA